MTIEEIIKALRGLRNQNQTYYQDQLKSYDAGKSVQLNLGRVEAYDEALRLLEFQGDPMEKLFPVFSITRELLVEHGYPADLSDATMQQIADHIWEEKEEYMQEYLESACQYVGVGKR